MRLFQHIETEVVCTNLSHFVYRCNVSLDVKDRVYKVSVKAVLTYTCEALPLKFEDVNQLSVKSLLCSKNYIHSVASPGYKRWF